MQNLIVPEGTEELFLEKSKLYNLKELPSEEFMKEKAIPWKPYRTIACCYLWMIVDDGNV